MQWLRCMKHKKETKNLLKAGVWKLELQRFIEIVSYRDIFLTIRLSYCSDSFTILGLWVLGLAVSNINESKLQTYES